MRLAGTFLFLYSTALTLSPAVRMHSWAVDYHWQHWIGFFAWLAGNTLLYRWLHKSLPNQDPYLLPISTLVSGWGLLTIWRLDASFGLRQTIWLLLGLGIVFLIARFPHWVDLLRRYKYIWLTIGLILTGLTFFVGSYPGGDGPSLWLGCCGVYLQPSEPLKLLLIIYLAAYLADQLPIAFNLGQMLAPTLVLAGVVIAILVAQRDLGTAILMILIYTFMVYMASARKRVLLFSLILLIAASVAGYATFDVIRVRVDSWLNPWLDPGGNSYQLVQSFLAFATGRLFGTGPGLGNPGFVPVAHSDFIAAAIGEETGLLGLVALLLLIGILVFRTLMVAMRANNNFHRFLAAGLGMYIGVQSILILGGNLRLLPLTGVTLPFVSYGGSSLITTFTALGLLLVISNSEAHAEPELPRLRPYVVIGALVSMALLALGLTAGWWAIVRSDDLQFRPDNLRWTIHARYVPRGAILDRSNQPIAITTGESGDLTRELLYPQLGTTIGYSHPIYGKGGLEASLDGYLTGLRGNAASTVWLAELMYAQPPPGMDVRLSLDLDLQKVADESLNGRKGAAVLIHASSGEILAISSQPSFDPNQIGEKWEAWRIDPAAPLLNRATQGQYPLGTIFTPFLGAVVTPAQPAESAILPYTLDGKTLGCAINPNDPLSWDKIIAAGCPGAAATLGKNLNNDQMRALIQGFGFTTTPEFELPTAEPTSADTISDPVLASLGRTDLKVSPLQMALAVAGLSNAGQRPAPRMALAVHTPHQGWVVLPGNPPVTSTMPLNFSEQLKLPDLGGLPVWEAVGQAETADGNPVTWYIAATVDTWPGTPLALALVLEEDDPVRAYQSGRNILRAAIQLD
jgi:cell division protein FtsW (lipid II flippase)